MVFIGHPSPAVPFFGVVAALDCTRDFTLRGIFTSLSLNIEYATRLHFLSHITWAHWLANRELVG